MADSNLEMRELRGDDVFVMFAILDKLGFSDKITDWLKQKDSADDAMLKQSGYQVIIDKNPASKEAKKALQEIEKLKSTITDESFDIIGQIIKLVLANLHTVKNELNTFLSNVLIVEMTPEKVAKLPIKQYVTLVKSFFVKPELKELLDLFE